MPNLSNPVGQASFNSSMNLHGSSQKLKRRTQAARGILVPVPGGGDRPVASAPAWRHRRRAVALSLLFLLAVAAFAFAAARAADEESEVDEITAGTLILHPRGGGADVGAVRL